MQPGQDAINAAQPEDSDTLEDQLQRILQHQASGRHEAAGQMIEDLLNGNPGNARLLHYKGLNLTLQGRGDEGMALMKEALNLAPDDALQLSDIGAQLATAGDLDAAMEYFHSAAEAAPRYAIAHSNLGGALVLQKKYGQAIAHLEKAIQLDTNLMDAHTNLGMAYMQVNNFQKAVDVLFKALAIDPQSVGAHMMLSAALYRRERYETAEHHARRAIELEPRASEAYLHLGNALSSSGKMDEATASFLKAAGRPPVGMLALSRLIHLRRTVPGAPELAMLERALERVDDMKEEQKATVHYAAGKAFDDLRRYDRAFENFHKANQISKGLHPFNGDAHAARIDRLAAFCSPDLMQRCAGGGIDAVAPIFICGMPRSGTTLMDQMFSRHPKVQAGGELRASMQAMAQNKRLHQALEEKLPDDQIVADDFTRLGESYIAAVRAEGIRSEYVSDKMPANYQFIGLLSLALPRAKFLIMRRHPLDNLLSNYFQHFGQNQPFASDFEHLAAVYRKFDETAKMWAERLPDRVRQVSYEAVTADAGARMREILDFVGLDWAPEVLDHKSSMRQVNTASISQVREPIYSHAVARWRNYADHLAPFATELRGLLTAQELAVCKVPKAH